MKGKKSKPNAVSRKAIEPKMIVDLTTGYVTINGTRCRILEYRVKKAADK